MKLIGRVLSLIMLLAFFSVIVYTGVALLKNISLASVLVFSGIFLMFGFPTSYFLGGIIASFCGRKVIGQIISTNDFNGDDDGYNGGRVNYAYTDFNGKIRFGTIDCENKQSGKIILIRYLGFFHHATMIDEISQEEYDACELSNIDMEEIRILYKKYNKMFWTVTPLIFVLSMALIIIGAILIS